jgi:hypothetical protein
MSCKRHQSFGQLKYSRSNEMTNSLNQAAAGRSTRNLALAAALLIASAGAAAAQTASSHKIINANEYYGLYQGASGGLSQQQIEHRTFDRSGTVGREGLGASPFHPEGPGDVAD